VQIKAAKQEEGPEECHLCLQVDGGLSTLRHSQGSGSLQASKSITCSTHVVGSGLLTLADGKNLRRWRCQPWSLSDDGKVTNFPNKMTFCSKEVKVKVVNTIFSSRQKRRSEGSMEVRCNFLDPNVRPRKFDVVVNRPPFRSVRSERSSPEV